MYTITLKKEGQEEHGEQIKVKDFDGGGLFLGGAYEVHGYDENGDFFSIEQRLIESVKDEDGNDFTDFGSQYFPDHPYGTKELPW